MELSSPVVLIRNEIVPPGKHVAVIWLARPLHAAGHPKVEISLDGRRGKPVPVPEMGDQGEIRPIVMPLDQADTDEDPARQNREVEIRVRIDPAGAPAVIDWRGVSWQENLKSD